MKNSIWVYRIVISFYFLVSILCSYLSAKFLINFDIHKGHNYGIGMYFLPHTKMDGIIDLVFWFLVLTTCIGLIKIKIWSWYLVHIIGIPFCMFYLLIQKRELLDTKPSVEYFGLTIVSTCVFIFIYLYKTRKINNLEYLYSIKTLIVLLIGAIIFSYVAMEAKGISLFKLLVN